MTLGSLFSRDATSGFLQCTHFLNQYFLVLLHVSNLFTKKVKKTTLLTFKTIYSILNNTQTIHVKDVATFIQTRKKRSVCSLIQASNAARISEKSTN